MAIAARVAERLALPHPISPETRRCHSKLRQRERFAEAKVPQPALADLLGLGGGDAAAERIGFPCVIRRRTGRGSAGSTLVRAADEVAEAAIASRSTHRVERRCSSRST